MTITYLEWASQINEILFYYDLRATLDGVECGQISKPFTNQWLRKKGYKLNWKNYSLETLN